MKTRTGFVSNSSSTCFICGDYCDSDDDLCDECATKKGSRVFARDFLRWLIKKGRIDPSAAYFGDDKIIDQWIEEYLKDCGL